MTATIKLGYEVGTGREVRIPGDRHIGITGQTQRSGKTTTIEAIIARSSGCALAFICKRGESSFKMQSAQIPPFFRDPLSTPDSEIAGWEYVQAILEAKMKTPLFLHRKFIMKACDPRAANKKKDDPGWGKPKTLRDVYDNCKVGKKFARAGFEEGMYYELEQFLKITLPEIEDIQRQNEKGLLERAKRILRPQDDPLTVKIGALFLAPGLNVMDIHKFSENTQSLVIAAAMREIYRHGRGVKVILPEAQRFWPQTQKALTTPVAQFGERIVREGAGIGNLIYLDSQDMAGVAKVMLRGVGVWLFGVQGERNEVKRTLEMIPDPGEGAMPTRTDLMTLKKGEFLVRYDGKLIKTYVQPGWLGDLDASAIATGEQDVEVARDIERIKFARPKSVDSKPDPVSEDAAAEQMSDDEFLKRACAAAPGQEGMEVLDSAVNWETRYMELQKQYANLHDEFVDLRGAHDALAARLEELNRDTPARTVELDPRATEAGMRLPVCATIGIIPNGPRYMGNLPPVAPTLLSASGIQVKSKSNGEWASFDPAQLDELYQQMRQRALAEEPMIMKLMATRPEITLTVTRKEIPMSTDTLPGMVGLLIHDGFFQTRKAASEIRDELLRRGCAAAKHPANVAHHLKGIVSAGFLYNEKGYYLAVEGLRVEKT